MPALRWSLVSALATLSLAVASPQPQSSPLWRRIRSQAAAGDEASSEARQIRRIAQPSSAASSAAGLNAVLVTPVTTTAAPRTTRKKLVTLAPVGDNLQAILFNNGYRETPADAEPEINNIDDETNLDGLNSKDVWLLDGNLLVLKGGDFVGEEFDDTQPLDDYEAPYREPRFPPRGLFGFSNLPPGVFGQGFTPRGLSLSDLARFSGGTNSQERLPKQPEVFVRPVTGQLRPYAPYAQYTPYGQGPPNSPYAPYAQNAPYVPYAPYTQAYNGPSQDSRVPPDDESSNRPADVGDPPIVTPTLPTPLDVSEQPDGPSAPASSPTLPPADPTEMDPSLSKKGASITSRLRPDPKDPTTYKGKSSITSRPEHDTLDPSFGKQGSSITSRPQSPSTDPGLASNPRPQDEASKAAVRPAPMFATITAIPQTHLPESEVFPTAPSVAAWLKLPTVPSAAPRVLPTVPSVAPRVTIPTVPSAAPRVTLPTVPSAAPRVSTPRPKQTYSVRKSYSTTTSTSSISLSRFGHHYLPPPRRARAGSAQSP